MNTFDQVMRVPVKRIDLKNGDDFLHAYAKERVPLVVNGLADRWPAFHKWSPEYFERTFPDLRFIPSINLPEIGIPFENIWKNHVREMTVKEFIGFMRTSDKPCYMHRQHINKFPGAANDVNFDDLLPADASNAESFMWVGSAGTRTGMHFDFQDNFLCQMYGRKHASIISPAYSRYLYPYKDSITKSRVDPQAPDFEKYQKFSNATVYECVLNPGEVLFIPRHWWHSIVSLEPSISLSHNYGVKLSFMDFMRSINAAGMAGWLTVAKDFYWHGVRNQKFDNRLFDDPPFGKLLYDMVAYSIKKRLPGAGVS